jgi:hypothetical protein
MAKCLVLCTTSRYGVLKHDTVWSYASQKHIISSALLHGTKDSAQSFLPKHPFQGRADVQRKLTIELLADMHDAYGAATDLPARHSLQNTNTIKSPICRYTNAEIYSRGQRSILEPSATWYGVFRGLKCSTKFALGATVFSKARSDFMKCNRVPTLAKCARSSFPPCQGADGSASALKPLVDIRCSQPQSTINAYTL